jgi:hypothetical protein
LNVAKRLETADFLGRETNLTPLGNGCGEPVELDLPGRGEPLEPLGELGSGLDQVLSLERVVLQFFARPVGFLIEPPLHKHVLLIIISQNDSGASFGSLPHRPQIGALVVGRLVDAGEAQKRRGNIDIAGR